MAVYQVVNGTVLRRRRVAAETVEEEARKGATRKLPTVATEVRRDFRDLNQLGRRTRSTR